jgi:hypothetical protein
MSVAPANSLPTPPDVRHLDFSIFHPQDHWPLDPRCRRLPGGIERHLHDWYTYRWDWHLNEIAGRLRCHLLRRHDWRDSWHAHRATAAQRAGAEHRPMFYNGQDCRWCERTNSAVPADACDGDHRIGG